MADHGLPCRRDEPIDRSDRPAREVKDSEVKTKDLEFDLQGPVSEKGASGGDRPVRAVRGKWSEYPFLGQQDTL